MLDLGKTFLQSAERSPHALAVIDGDVRWTYGQWALRIGALQRTLFELGLRHGDHVVSVLQNRHEAATLHWACQFAGLVMTPLNCAPNPMKCSTPCKTAPPSCWCTRMFPAPPCSQP